MTPLEIGPATFWLVVQCLNQLSQQILRVFYDILTRIASYLYSWTGDSHLFFSTGLRSRDHGASIKSVLSKFFREKQGYLKADAYGTFDIYNTYILVH